MTIVTIATPFEQTRYSPLFAQPAKRVVLVDALFLSFVERQLAFSFAHTINASPAHKRKQQ
jgi:hypothetical protein